MLFLFRKNFMPFLEEDGKGGAGGTGGEPGGGEPSGGAEDQNKGQKTFTQEDLNRIAAQEKRQGANSILKALGFESEEKAKEYLMRKKMTYKKPRMQKQLLIQQRLLPRQKLLCLRNDSKLLLWVFLLIKQMTL